MGVIRHFSRGRERYSVFLRNPFVAESDLVSVFSGNDATQREIYSSKNDSTAENALKEMSLPALWSAMVASYSRVASTAIQLLMPFSLTWLCEACFSALLKIKNKARNKIIAKRDQKCALPLPSHALTSLSPKCNTSHPISAAVKFIWIYIFDI